jgi:DNA-binding LytR/AlgR family response regulator
VCDDEKEQAAETAAHIKKHPRSHTVCTYDSAIGLLEDYRNGVRHDLIFLDIRMADLDGFSAASVLRREFPNEMPLIAFLTVTDEYAVKGYGLAWRYIRKPATKEEIHRVLDEAGIELEKRSVTIETTEGFRRIEIADITHVDAYYGAVRIHCGSGEHVAKSKFFEIAAMLPETKFFAVHRSYLINLARIGSFDRDKSDITLDDKVTRIPLSRRRRKAFVLAFAHFLRVDGHA